MEAVNLTQSPLKACLFILRFSSIELMEDFYIPTIQDKYRKEGLPVFVKQKVEDLSTHGEIEKQKNWVFSDLEKNNLVIVNKEAFAFQTFTYKNFDEFQNKFLHYFEIFAQITEFYQNNILEFAGLRYINAIEGNNWQLYLNKSYQGINFPEGVIDTDYIQYNALYAQGTTEIGLANKGNLVVKTLQNSQGFLFPPDILLLDPQIEKKGKFVTLLDIDHFSLLKIKINDKSFLENISSSLHKACEKVFFNAITEKAVEKWR